MFISYLLFNYLRVNNLVKIDKVTFDLLCNTIHLLKKA